MQRLASGSGVAWHPLRARTLAYAGKDGIYTATIGGSRRRLLAARTAISELTWSPDGKGIAASIATGAETSEIYAIPVGRGRKINVSRNGLSNRDPAWSPDGRRIAWTGGDGVWIANADGSATRRLSSTPAARSTPAWSPDGRSIVFSGAFGTNCTLYLAQLPGGAARPLLGARDQPRGANGCDIHPVWFR